MFPDRIAREMRLAAAMYCYSRGEISQKPAAEIDGLDRTDLLLAWAQRRGDVLAVDWESLDKQIEPALKRIRE